MGCGASKAVETAEPQTKNANADDKAQAPEHAGHGGLEQKAQGRQLEKVSSQLGSRVVQNSFVVQKTRSKKRSPNDPEGERKKVERDPNWIVKEEEPLNKDAEKALQLPAESVMVAEPERQGPAASGHSFKMARGAQAQLLAELASKGQLQDMPANKDKLNSEDPEVVLEGVTYFREQLSVVNPPVAAVRGSGILPTLVGLLEQSQNRRLQYEVAWILTNICSAEHEDCAAVVDQNAIPIFVSLLKSCQEADVLEQAIWALGNIAADCTELQRAVLDEEVVPPLLGCMERHMNTNVSVLRHCAWLLSNLCRPKPQDDALLDTIHIACHLVSSCEDQEATTHACWSLAYLTGEESGLQVLSESPDLSSTLSKLVVWVEEGDSIFTIPSLRILGNLCSGSNTNVQAVVDAGGLPAMLACLDKSDRVSLKKEVVWALSNIAAGTSSQVEAMAQAGAFPKVIAVLRTSEESLRRECTFVLANPWALNVGISNAVAQLLFKEGVILELVNLIDPAVEPSIVKAAVDGLQEATRRGQQMMKEEAEALSQAGEEDIVVTNRIVDTIKELGAVDKLQAMLAIQDAELHAKAYGLKNILAVL